MSAPWFSTPASELSDSQPPEGYRHEWVRDFGSRPATPDEHESRKCRRPRCEGKPVMAFQRSRWSRSGTKRHWWLYCAAHMYGRRIENGVVEFRRAVPNEELA